MDVAQVAARLSTSVFHIRRLVQERRIPYLKVGGLVRFDPTDVDTWLASHRVGPVVTRPDWRR